MFSERLKNELKNLGVDSSQSVTKIRYILEDKLDEKPQASKEENQKKHQIAKKVYSIFMNEYTKALDVRDSLFK